MKAIKLKNWCLDNITPQSWDRIILKTLPKLRSNGLELGQVQEPTGDFEISEDVVEILNDAIEEIYQLKVDEEVMTS